MKIIVSHDVDHLFWGEHFFDRYLFGSVYRAFKDAFYKRESLPNIAHRFLDYRLHNIDELLLFDQQYGVQPTYFFGMDNALSLSYHYKRAELFVNKVLENGCYLGLHGINFDSELLMSCEKKRLLHMLPEGYRFGVRNHYLRQNESTKQIQNKLGFLFDSTDYGKRSPYLTGQLIEFPISIMDVTLEREANFSLERMKTRSLQLIEQYHSMDRSYFVVNFHDVYYTNGFQRMKQWYEWLIEHFYSQNYTFTSFNQECK